MFQKELLEKNLQEGNMEAAKQMIAEYFSQDASEQERAEAYTLIAEIYLRSSNRINKEYLEGSTETMKILDEIQGMENNLKDASDLADARETLK